MQTDSHIQANLAVIVLIVIIIRNGKLKMNKQITVHYYDCCLSDYFGGHHKPVLHRPVDGNTTRKDLYWGLLSELAEGVIDWQIDQNELDYDAIRAAIRDCLYFAEQCKDDDIVFPKLEKWDDNDDDIDYPCYAFFIVDWSDSE